MPVTCVYKHVNEVTRTTVEDVTQVVEEDNIISDDQLSSVVSRMNNINNESDSHLTEQEQIVYEILRKKQEINAIQVKERSADDKKQLEQYNGN